MREAIGPDSPSRATAPIKPRTHDLKPADPRPAQKASQKPAEQEKDQMRLGRGANRASGYLPAQAKEEEKNWLEKTNDAVLDPMGKVDATKGMYVKYLVEPLQEAGTKLGKALAVAEDFAPVRLFGKAAPILGIIPTAFDIKAAFDAHKDPKVKPRDRDLATAKAVFSTISTGLGVAALASAPAPPVAAGLAVLSLTFSVAAWATDLGKSKP